MNTADRWHLFKNLADALKRLVVRQRPSLKPPPLLASSPPVLPSVTLETPVRRPPDHVRYGAEARHERYLHRVQLYGQMQALHAAGFKPRGDRVPARRRTEYRAFLFGAGRTTSGTPSTATPT
jgi:hypothetical protein